jgi:hypothetical protein
MCDGPKEVLRSANVDLNRIGARQSSYFYHLRSLFYNTLQLIYTLVMQRYRVTTRFGECPNDCLRVKYLFYFEHSFLHFLIVWANSAALAWNTTAELATLSGEKCELKAAADQAQSSVFVDDQAIAVR